MRLSPRDPNMPFWLGFAGFAELERGRYREAIDYLVRARSMNPEVPRTAVTLIAARALSGDIGEARLELADLQRAFPHLTRETLRKMYGRINSKKSHTREGLFLALGQPS
jgi:hypothetical protein